jgi:quinol-cytochrome oxidoreductase complex cytochrome b subunit
LVLLVLPVVNTSEVRSSLYRPLHQKFFWLLVADYLLLGYLGHTDNYIPGNPMVTPEHIVPEWYFLPAYAILRSIPNKLLGVLALFAAVLILLVLPIVNTSEVRSSLYRPLHKFFFWLLVADYLILGYLGQQVPESPFIEIGQIASVYYFAYFLVIIPVLGRFEKNLRFL